MITALLVCDDGFCSPGFGLLRQLAERVGFKYTMIGPEQNCSGYGSARSFDPLEVAVAEKGNLILPNGTPVDCVTVGLLPGSRKVLAKMGVRLPKFDLVLSGVNYGANVGIESLSCSGTFCAAVHAAKLGVPAIAISQDVRNWTEDDFPKNFNMDAAIGALRFCGMFMRPEDGSCQVFNVNLPSSPRPVLKCVRTCVAMDGGYTGDWAPDRIADLKWHQTWSTGDATMGTDVAALLEGNISVTGLPFACKSCNVKALKKLAKTLDSRSFGR